MTSAATIKQLSKDFLVTLCNTRDFTSPLLQKHVSLEFAATHGDNPPSTGRDDFLTKWQKALAFMPDFRIEILDAVAEVDEESGKGKVWVFSKMSGIPGRKLQDSVDMMEWEGDVCVRTKNVQRVAQA